VSTFIVYLLGALSLVGADMLLALGITVIYQASRVLNLAHGAMAMCGAYTTYELAVVHVPVPLAVIGGILAGGVLGLLVERVFVRQLRGAGPTTQTVGTVAVLTLAIAVASRLFGTLPVPAPQVLPQGALTLGSGFVAWNALGIFPIGIVGAAILFGLLQFTDIGLAMRGAAQNRRGAALRGVNPDFTAALAWTVGGAFAALAGILVAAETELDPFTVSLGVLPAFIAALIGGLDSMPAVCIGAALIGTVQGMVPWMSTLPVVGKLAQGQGAPELVLGVLALVVMAMRGQRLTTGDVRGDTL
jgi:branched-subunit amino acid ABC-type transport system permease component